MTSESKSTCTLVGEKKKKINSWQNISGWSYIRNDVRMKRSSETLIQKNTLAREEESAQNIKWRWKTY